MAGKWLAAAFLLVAAGIGAIWYSTISAYEAAVLRERGRELQAIAELKIEFLRFWLAERRSDAAVQSRRPLMAIAAAGRGADTWTYGSDALPGQLEEIRREYGYEAVLLLDAKGNLRASAGSSGEGELFAAGNAARSAMETRQILVSRAYHTDDERHLDIDIAAPVTDTRQPGAPIVGALVFHLDPREHLDTFLRRWPAPSASGESFLVERTNGKLAYLSSLRHAEAAGMRMNLDEPSLPAAMAARGAQGITEGRDYRGVQVLAAIGQVPDMPWFVVSKIDREEILAPVRREALWSGTLSAFLVLALALTMFSWQRRGQSELALAQQESTKAALAASEARFRRLIENAWDLLVLFDRDMRITYASPSVDQQLGRNVVGEGIASGTALVHPEDVGRVEAARINALAHPGAPQRFEHRLKGRYDHWMTVEATFTNHFDDPDIGALAYAGRDVSERMWAEQALRDSEGRYRFLFKLSPDAVFVHRNGVIFQTNDAAVRLFRAESENALIGRHWRQLVAPERRSFVEQRIALLENGEQAYLQPAEQRYLALDGQPIEVEATGARIVIDGKPAIMSVVRDISERKRAEAALKDSEARYRFLFEGSPLPMWVYDAETFAFLEVNRAAVAQYGYSRAEFLGMTLRDIRPPEDVSSMEEAARSPLPQQGRVWRHLRKDGSLIHVAIWRQPTSLSGPPAHMIVAENVTARVEAERALRESESTLRILLDAIPGVALIANAAGNIVFANRGFERTTGVSRENLVGVNGLSLFPPDVAALRRKRFEEAIAQRTILRFEDSRNGSDYEYFFCPTAGESGEVARVAIIAFDITERRQAEAQRLAFAHAQRDTLVREVHHRIKNHLQGLAGLLRQHMNEQPVLEPVLEKFAAQVNAISMVHGLQGKTEKGNASLRNLAAEIAAFLGSITGVAVGLSCPGNACLWAVDEAEAVPLALILNELLTNALRHGTDKARVSLAIACDANGARLIVRNPGRLDAGLKFAAGKGLGTGLNLIRSLLPPAGVTLSLENSDDGWVEARLELLPPVLLPMAQVQVVSLR